MNRRKKVFNRVVNPLLLKYLTDPNIEEHSIAKNIPMKYLKYFKEIIKKYKLKLRIRYRGSSTDTYKRNPSFMHMDNATSFAVYER